MRIPSVSSAAAALLTLLPFASGASESQPGAGPGIPAVAQVSVGPKLEQFRTFSVEIPGNWKRTAIQVEPRIVKGVPSPAMVHFTGPDGEYLHVEIAPPPHGLTVDARWRCEVLRGGLRITAEGEPCHTPAGAKPGEEDDDGCGEGDGRLDLFAECGEHFFGFGNSRRERKVDLDVFRRILSSVEFREPVRAWSGGAEGLYERVTSEQCDEAEDDAQRVIIRMFPDPSKRPTEDPVPEVYRHFRKYRDLYGPCALGETQCAMVQRLLLSHWDKAMGSLDLAAGDPRFEAFLLRGLSAFASAEDYRTIRRAAAENCPTRRRGLCQRIIEKCDAGLRSIAAQPMPEPGR